MVHDTRLQSDDCSSRRHVLMSCSKAVGAPNKPIVSRWQHRPRAHPLAAREVGTRVPGRSHLFPWAQLGAWSKGRRGGGVQAAIRAGAIFTDCGCSSCQETQTSQLIWDSGHPVFLGQLEWLLGGQRGRRPAGKSSQPSFLSSPSVYTLTSWTTRSGREPRGTSLREGHRSLGVLLVSGANQPDHNDVIRATALEGRGLVFLGRVPTPIAVCLGSSCPEGVGSVSAGGWPRPGQEGLDLGQS